MKKKIAVVMGGTTSEHDISLRSGNVVMQNLPQELFEVIKVIIKKNNDWVVHHEGEEISIDKTTFSYSFKNSNYTFDAVFNAVHGAPGENGILQALLDKAGIPYTGCSSEVSRLTYNKYNTLEFLQPHGVSMAKRLLIKKGDSWEIENILGTIGLPCFVKANKAGSSFGVVKVTQADQISNAINTAMNEDDEVLVEGFLSGTEVSIGVIEFQKNIVVLPPTEIVSNGDFFDYAAKYEGNSTEITPARLSKKQLHNLREAARKVFICLGVSGLSRSDFIFIGDTPYFLELNSIPGLTNESLLPQQAKHLGIELSDLFTDMISSCLKSNTFDV
ncbi:MAG: D-alanine--D-alanine ligase [Flavobacteriaceae bacterium]|nr:D-alanine--D-alanine ligase [Flavobacteriaceae bacterium]